MGHGEGSFRGLALRNPRTREIMAPSVIITSGGIVDECVRSGSGYDWVTYDDDGTNDVNCW